MRNIFRGKKTNEISPAELWDRISLIDEVFPYQKELTYTEAAYNLGFITETIYYATKARYERLSQESRTEQSNLYRAII